MRRKAFSLVETLIALVILAIALLALATVPIAATRMLTHGIWRERALAVAMAKIEEVEAVLRDGPNPPVSSNEGGFAWERTVKRNGPDSFSVEVKVNWDGVMGRGDLSLSRDLGPYSSRR